MDNSYCLVHLIWHKYIILYLFKNNYHKLYPLCLISNDSKKIFQLMSRHNYFLNLSMDHSLYLGQELYKAEIALRLGQCYIQD